MSETSMAEDAGEEPPRDAASAQDAAGLVDAAPPPERGCGVVRRIALPYFDPVVRVPGELGAAGAQDLRSIRAGTSPRFDDEAELYEIGCGDLDT